MAESLTVLVVDDLEPMREVMVRFLNLKGYEVLAAASGNSALDLFAKEKVDVIVSDIQMDDGNGFELAVAARKLNPDIPFIFITGFEMEGARKKARELGADGFLMKPFFLDSLLQLIQKVTDPGYVRSENPL